MIKLGIKVGANEDDIARLEKTNPNSMEVRFILEQAKLFKPVLNYAKKHNIQANFHHWAAFDGVLANTAAPGKDKNIHGIIVQLPLPTILDTKRIITAVPANKDVDGFNHESPFTPPVALGVLEIIKATEKNLHSKNIVVLGRGITGGDTVIRTLDKLNIPHVVIHSKTHNPDEILKKGGHNNFSSW